MPRKTKAVLRLEERVVALLKQLDIVSDLNTPRSQVESAIGLSGAIERIEKRVGLLEANVAALSRNQK